MTSPAGGLVEGRIAIVTGAAGGIGQELARGLLGEGARVAALDVDEQRLGTLVNTCTDETRADRILGIPTDISRYEECEAAVGRVRAHFGDLHILINNGAVGMGLIRADHMTRLVGIDEITPEMWDRVTATNYSGAWYMTRASVGGMLAAEWGRIVNVTTSFFTMLRGRFHPYGPAKAGLEAMSAGHAEEFVAGGVTVNVVVPGGPTDTPLVPAESGFDRSALIPPSAMVAPMVWICSDAAGDATGHRYVAAEWDESLDPAEAAAGCRAPIAWPGLAQNPVWPGGRPAG